MLSKVSGVVLCAVLFHQSLTPLAGCVIKHFPLRILQKKKAIRHFYIIAL